MLSGKIKIRASGLKQFTSRNLCSQNRTIAVAIERSRELLGGELSALVGESYERAYGDMVRVQQLTELEEVIRYQQSFAGKRLQIDPKSFMLVDWVDVRSRSCLLGYIGLNPICHIANLVTGSQTSKEVQMEVCTHP